MFRGGFGRARVSPEPSRRAPRASAPPARRAPRRCGCGPALPPRPWGAARQV